LGQFELARAIWLRLYRNNPQSALNVSRTIVCLGAPQDWLCSVSVPSAAHLSWLSSTLEYNVNATVLPTWKRAQLEFDIILTEVLLDGSSINHQVLSPDVVNTLRYHFFCSLRLEDENNNNNNNDPSATTAASITSTNHERKHTEGHRNSGPSFSSSPAQTPLLPLVHRFRERLPPFHILPCLSFLPPVKSYLPAQQAPVKVLQREIETP
jgi:hypothetical protein